MCMFYICIPLCAVRRQLLINFPLHPIHLKVKRGVRRDFDLIPSFEGLCTKLRNPSRYHVFRLYPAMADFHSRGCEAVKERSMRKKIVSRP